MNPHQLKNRKQIDILESYLGEEAFHFQWNDHYANGYVSTVRYAPCIRHYLSTKRSTNIVEKIKLKFVVTLTNYPGDKAEVVFLLDSGRTNPFLIEKALLSDPNGREIISKKIKQMLFVFNSVAL